MALVKGGYSVRWLIFLVCIILGTFMGIFFQHFSVTAPLFRDVVDLKFGIGEVDLLAIRFSFDFALRMNLGTLFGGIAGLLVTR